MSRDLEKKFAYRVNEDGSIDSICMRCYLTVAASPVLEELAEAEARHQCQEKSEKADWPPPGFPF